MADERPLLWNSLGQAICNDDLPKPERHKAAVELLREHDRTRGVRLAKTSTAGIDVLLEEKKARKNINWKDRSTEIAKAEQQIQTSFQQHKSNSARNISARSPSHRHRQSSTRPASAENPGLDLSTVGGTHSPRKHTQLTNRLNNMIGGYNSGKFVATTPHTKDHKNLAAKANQSKRKENQELRLLKHLNMRDVVNNPKWSPGVGFEWRYSWDTPLGALRSQNSELGRLRLPNTLVCGVGPEKKYCLWLQSWPACGKNGGALTKHTVFEKDELPDFKKQILKQFCKHGNQYKQMNGAKDLPLCVLKKNALVQGSTLIEPLFTPEQVKMAFDDMQRHSGTPISMQVFIRAKGKRPWFVRVVHKKNCAALAYVVSNTQDFPVEKRTQVSQHEDPVDTSHFDQEVNRTKHPFLSSRSSRNVKILTHRSTTVPSHLTSPNQRKSVTANKEESNAGTDAAGGGVLGAMAEKVRQGKLIEQLTTSTAKALCEVFVSKEAKAFKKPKAMLDRIVRDLEGDKGLEVEAIGADFIQDIDGTWFLMQIKSLQVHESASQPNKKKKKRGKYSYEGPGDRLGPGESIISRRIEAWSPSRRFLNKRPGGFNSRPASAGGARTFMSLEEATTGASESEKLLALGERIKAQLEIASYNESMMTAKREQEKTKMSQGSSVSSAITIDVVEKSTRPSTPIEPPKRMCFGDYCPVIDPDVAETEALLLRTQPTALKHAHQHSSANTAPRKVDTMVPFQTILFHRLAEEPGHKVTEIENQFLFDTVPVCATCATVYLETKRRKEAELKAEAVMAKARKIFEREAHELAVQARKKFVECKEQEEINRLAAALLGHEETWTKKQKRQRTADELERARKARAERCKEDELDGREEGVVVVEESKGPLKMLMEKEDVDLFTGELISVDDFDLFTGEMIVDVPESA